MKNVKVLVALITGLFTFTSAQAGEMSVTGSMQATYQSEQDNVTGNPLGLNTDLKFTGTTELDNGTSVTWSLATDGTFLGDSGADHTLKFASPYGTFKIGNAGDSANAVDDITPTAFEEANGSGSGSYAVDLGSGMEGSMSLGYNLADIAGTGISVDYTYYPRLDSTTNNEKGASGDTASTNGSAESINVAIPFSSIPVVGDTALGGLKMTVGYENVETKLALVDEKEGGTVAFNYAMGPVALGYQKKIYQPTMTTHTDSLFYKDDIIGIVFAVNDGLKVSYNIYESDKKSPGNVVEQETKAINAAYTVGGLTIAFQDAKTDNSGYSSGTENDTRTVSIKTAF